MNWGTMVMLSTEARRSDGRSLTVQVGALGDGRWTIVAIETGVTRVEGRPVEQTLDALFDDHAHQQLPPEPTLSKAIAVAEKYAKWWQRSRATHDDCACEAIDDKDTLRPEAAAAAGE